MTAAESLCLAANYVFTKNTVLGRESPQSYSEEDYRAAKHILVLYGSHIELQNKRVLDAGCGLRRKTVFYGYNPCRLVVGIDMDANHIK